MHEYLLWIPLAVYTVHVLEEATLNWRTWVQQSLGLEVSWFIFCIANSAVMFFTIATAMVGWKIPAFALSISALMIINAIFFHILPTILQKRFSPGVITATLLFVPTSIFIYYCAHLDGVLSVSVLIQSLILGALIMASPMLFLRLQKYLDV